MLFGPSGVGETHLAISITMAMVKQAQACRFFPATALQQLLQTAKVSVELPALIQKLGRYSLLVIDDISNVRRSELESSVLFELICHGMGIAVRKKINLRSVAAEPLSATK